MLIRTPIRALGRVDCRSLAALATAAPEAAWFDDVRRQTDYDVHAETQSIILRFLHRLAGSRRQRPGWEPFAAAAMPIVQAIIGQHTPKAASSCVPCWPAYDRAAGFPGTRMPITSSPSAIAFTSPWPPTTRWNSSSANIVSASRGRCFRIKQCHASSSCQQRHHDAHSLHLRLRTSSRLTRERPSQSGRLLGDSRLATRREHGGLYLVSLDDGTAEQTLD